MNKRALLALVLAWASVAFPVLAQDKAEPRLATVAVQNQGAAIEIGQPVPLELTLSLEDLSAAPQKVTLRPSDEAKAQIVVEDEVVPGPQGQGQFLATGRFLTTGEEGQPLTVAPLEATLFLSDGSQVEYRTEPIEVAVAPPALEAGAPADYSELMLPPPDYVKIASYVVGGALLTTALLWVLIMLLRRRRAVGPSVAAVPPPLPPLEEARQALARLASLEVFHAHGAKTHYVELSNLVRRYFERQFAIPALEMSEEALVIHGRRELPPSVAMVEIARPLENASLAKYAKWTAPEDAAREDAEAVRRFLALEEQRLAVRQLQAQTILPPPPPPKGPVVPEATPAKDSPAA